MVTNRLSQETIILSAKTRDVVSQQFKLPTALITMRYLLSSQVFQRL
jgi:hypothetical protein